MDDLRKDIQGLVAVAVSDLRIVIKRQSDSLSSNSDIKADERMAMIQSAILSRLDSSVSSLRDEEEKNHQNIIGQLNTSKQRVHILQQALDTLFAAHQQSYPVGEAVSEIRQLLHHGQKKADIQGEYQRAENKAIRGEVEHISRTIPRRQENLEEEVKRLRKQISDMGRVLNQQRTSFPEDNSPIAEEVRQLRLSFHALHETNIQTAEELRQLRLSLLNTGHSPDQNGEERQNLKAKIDAQVYMLAPFAPTILVSLLSLNMSRTNRLNSLGLSTKQKLDFTSHMARLVMESEMNLPTRILGFILPVGMRSLQNAIDSQASETCSLLEGLEMSGQFSQFRKGFSGPV